MDLVARALGRAAMMRVNGSHDPDRPFDRAYARVPETAIDFREIDYIDYEQARLVNECIIREISRSVEAEFFENVAGLVRKIHPEWVIDGDAIIQRMDELLDIEAKYKTLRRKYRWIPVTEALPKHGRRVLIYTEYGVYRGYYDRKWNCWRTTRSVSRVTHWRNQDDPENWA